MAAAQRQRVRDRDHVPAGRPGIAAFDFDGTLTRGGSVLPFLVAARGLLPVLFAVVRTLPALASAAVVGGSAADNTKERLFGRLLAGQPVERIDRVAAIFAKRHLDKRLRPEVQRRLEWHRMRGDTVVVVSASPDCYVARAGELLGADAVLATRLQSSGNLLTGRYEGRNCRGAEKYGRLAGWMAVNGITGNGAEQPELWAYGNSRGDLRLLNAADHGVDTGRLGRFGRLSTFPSLSSLTPGD